MIPIRIYTTPWCGYCMRAKHLLTSLGADYEEVNLWDDPVTAEQLQQKHHWYSAPMIFFGEEFMGGYDDIAALDRKGLLRAKIFGS